jgi:hypothetical protein
MRFRHLPYLLAFLCATLASSANAQSVDYVIYSRLAERLVVAGAGILCLWMGFQLFKLLNENRTELLASVATIAKDAANSPTTVPAAQSSFEAKLGEVLSVKMSQVGPGIFFALFGASLLGFVMYSSVKYSKTSGIEELLISAANPTARDTIKAQWVTNLIHAIAVVQTYEFGGQTTDAAKRKLSDAIANLRGSIPFLIDLAFGVGSYSRYQQAKGVPEAQRTSEGKALVEEIDTLLDGL